MEQKKKEESLKLAIETSANAVSSVVKYSTDANFSSQCQLILQTDDSHGTYCKTSETLWQATETLYGVNAFQCKCKRKFALTNEDDNGSLENKSCGSLEKKQCTFSEPPSPDYFELVEDDYLRDICQKIEQSAYDDVPCTDMNNNLIDEDVALLDVTDLDTENNEQVVPQIHRCASCDWFEEVLKEE